MLSSFLLTVLSCLSVFVGAQQPNGQTPASSSQTNVQTSVPTLEPTCVFPKDIRGKWMFINWENRDSKIDSGLYVNIRDTHVEIDEQFTKDNTTFVRTRVFFCKQYHIFKKQRAWQLLVESAVAGKSGHLLCLGLQEVKGTSKPMMSLRRTIGALPNQAYFDPVFSRTAATVASICTVLNNTPLFIRAMDPGCVFPRSLQKVWSYGGKELKTISFSGSLASVTPLGVQRPYIFQCERIDELTLAGDNNFLLLMRTKGLKKMNGSIVDGVLCLKVVLDDATTGRVTRFNTGTLMNNAVKEINPKDVVYIQKGTTCDLVDQSVKPLSFTATTV